MGAGGRPYFLLVGGTVYLCTFVEGSFSDLRVVYDIRGTTGNQSEFLIDRERGVMHVLVRGSWGGKGGFLEYVRSTDGEVFTAPERFVDDEFQSRFVSRPQLLEDGTLLVAYYEETWVSDFWAHDVFYNVYRGFGLGSPRLLADTGWFDTWSAPPVLRRFSGDGIGVVGFDARYDYRHDWRLHMELYLYEGAPLDVRQPLADAQPKDLGQGLCFSSGDTFWVSLDLYNPLDEPLEAELVVVTNVTLGGGPDYYFLSADPVFPSFQKEFYSFPVVLAPHEVHQNFRFFEFYFDTIYYQYAGLFWDWYAALLDPQTGELIGDYSRTDLCYIR